MDDTAQLDFDLGYVIDLGERNEELEAEAASKMVPLSTTSSYGSAAPQARVQPYRTKYDTKLIESQASGSGFLNSPEKVQLRKP